MDTIRRNVSIWPHAGPDSQTMDADAYEIEPVSRPLIEIGWIIAGRLDEPDLKATQKARDIVKSWLRETLPDFEWKLPLVQREEVVNTQRIESVELLDYGVTERNLRHWDFTLLVTPADLVSHYKNDALSVVSRSMHGAVISTDRIDPRAYEPSIPEDDRINVMTQRMRALAIHVLGHLTGLEHAEEADSFMAAFETVEDLDTANRLAEAQTLELRKGLWEVADRRLEEQTDVRRAWRPRFYAQAAWINRRQIAEAVFQAKPWQFPFRLNRLTTAAASAMLVLMITAEAWELGLSQPSLLLAALAIGAIVLTTFYVVSRQRLYVRREHARLSELSVVTNVSTFAIVFAGMATTFAILACVTLLCSQLFFQRALVASWAPSVASSSGLWQHAKLASFVASIGMFIGALGASFEENHYFRHITYVDEEI